MRLGLDVLRLLRSVLGFGGHYRIAAAVGLVLAVGWLVLGATSGAYATTEPTPTTEPTATATAEPTPTAEPSPAAEPTTEPEPTAPAEPTDVRLVNDQYAALLFAGGATVALLGGILFVQIGVR